MVAAVSGGSDSVALFSFSASWPPQAICSSPASPICITTFAARRPTRMRRSAARSPARRCGRGDRRCGCPRAGRRAGGVSIEVAGRKARQRFFVEALASLGGATASAWRTRATIRPKRCCCGWCAARGRQRAGRHGAAGAITSCGRCSSSTRIELRDILAAIGEPWREDATNEDRAIPRNRIRHEVLPLLARAQPARRRRAGPRGGHSARRRRTTRALANEAVRRFVRTIGRAVRVAIDAAGSGRVAARRSARRVGAGRAGNLNPGQSYGLEEADRI